jgi:hypothetical protein
MKKASFNGLGNLVFTAQVLQENKLLLIDASINK